MRKLLFTIAFAVFGLCANAATCGDDYELIILLSDSSTVTCDFTKTPQMSFSDNQIVLEQVAGEAQRWEFDEVLSWSFGIVSAVNDAEQANENTLAITDNAIQARGKADSQLTVCDMQGKVLRRINADAEGKASVNISEFAPAVYIVHFGKNSVKFYKR